MYSGQHPESTLHPPPSPGKYIVGQGGGVATRGREGGIGNINTYPKQNINDGENKLEAEDDGSVALGAAHAHGFSLGDKTAKGSLDSFCLRTLYPPLNRLHYSDRGLDLRKAFDASLMAQLTFL